MVVLIMFLLFEIFVLEEEWQGLVMSLSLGILLGIVWANVTYQQQIVALTDVPSDSFPSLTSSDGTKVSTCSASSGNQNEDMVCRAFRL
jgi:hypothetical protein